MRFAKKLQFFHRLLAPIVLTVALLGCVDEGRAEALLLVEADSGRVLHAENATHPWYPASVTKLMTAYVTLRAVKEGRLSFDTLLTVSPNAVAQQPSKMGFKAGTQVTVDNAIKMLMVKSANDMAVVLAEGVSESIEQFADDMNRTARRLGMTQTSYVNPNGLPADGQVTSARDQAILARAILRDLPEYDLYWHLPAIKFGRRTMRNYNTLIGRYRGADGMKTGFICASGFNLVASATRNGRRLIAVVLGAPSSPVRAVKAAHLLERGFTSNPLSWLTPSLGTVESLVPVNAEPPNLRDEMCGKHRKRPAAESEDDDEPVEANNNGENGTAISSLGSIRAKPSSLLGPLNPTMDPVVVFVGPGKKKPGETEIAATNANTARDAKATAAAAAPNNKTVPLAWPAPNGPPQQITPSPVTAPAFAATNPPAWPAAPAFNPHAPQPSSSAVPLPRKRPQVTAPAPAQ